MWDVLPAKLTGALNYLDNKTHRGEKQPSMVSEDCLTHTPGYSSRSINSTDCLPVFSSKWQARHLRGHPTSLPDNCVLFVWPLHTGEGGAQEPNWFSHTCALLLILPVFLSPHLRGAATNLSNTSVFLKATSKRELSCRRGNYIWNWTIVWGDSWKRPLHPVN